MKRAALYIRVSTEEQARHGLSLGEQRADLTEYAKQHGYVVYDIYADEGATARKAISRRKELQRLLLDVVAGNIDIIIFKCLDRWFRNIKDYYSVQTILEENHVEWECTQEEYNTTTTNGRLLLNLKLSIAQNESDQTSDRIKYIYDGKRRRGEALNGMTTFGYRIEDKKFIVNKEEARVVSFAFNHLLEGNSMRSVPKAILQQFGLFFTYGKVYHWFRNELYTGTRYGIKDYAPAIISKDTFARVQQILSGHKKRRSGTNIFLFSGKMRCPGCGGIMAARMQQRYTRADGTLVKVPYYLCNTHFNSGGFESCDYGGGITEAKLEAWLLENIIPELEKYQVQLKLNAPDIPKLTRQLKAQEAKLDRLNDLYTDGIITRLELHAKRQQIIAVISETEQELKGCRQLSNAASMILSSENFGLAYEKMTRQKKKALWQQVIKEIKIGRGLPGRYAPRKIDVIFF